MARSATAPGPDEVTGLLELSSWPAGMRVIICKERIHVVKDTGQRNLPLHYFAQNQTASPSTADNHHCTYEHTHPGQHCWLP
jgi:hypothetical protein